MTTILRAALASFMKSSTAGIAHSGALASSWMKVTPSSRNTGLMRRGKGGTVLIACAATVSGSPIVRPTAIAARAQCTRCAPGNCV